MSEIKIAPERKLTDRDLRRVFWRSCMLDSSWNYERQQNIGYSFGIVPVIEEVLRAREREAEARLRPLARFHGHHAAALHPPYGH